jgi:hypothetical protein
MNSLRRLIVLLFGPRVFVSYADVDRHYVERELEMAEVFEARVFFAPRSIPKGSRWEQHLTKNVRRCSKMIVFWCEHASSSSWVKREYQMAIGLGKRVVPVLLDNTEVPPDLAARQGLDWRGHGGHASASGPAPASFIAVSEVIRNDTALTPRHIERRLARSRQANLTLMFAGLLLVALAAWRPFPTPFQSELLTLFNLLVLVLGAVLIYSAGRDWQRVHRLPKGKPIEDDARQLAIALNALLT